MNKKLLALSILSILLLAGCVENKNNSDSGVSKTESVAVVYEKEVVKIQPQEYTEFEVKCWNNSYDWYDMSDYTSSYTAEIQFSDIPRKHDAEKVEYYPDLRWVIIHGDYDRDIEMEFLIRCRADFDIPYSLTKFYAGNEIYNTSERMWFNIRTEYNLHSLDDMIEEEIRNRMQTLNQP